MRTTPKERAEVHTRLERLGIACEDRHTLRRIAMTLHRWFELECGDGNSYGSWAIERDENGEGRPYYVNHAYPQYVKKTRILDRETGARKRLNAIMARYPQLLAYVQTDPRGASLYLVTKEQHKRYALPLDQMYNHGVAVY